MTHLNLLEISPLWVCQIWKKSKHEKVALYALKFGAKKKEKKKKSDMLKFGISGQVYVEHNLAKIGPVVLEIRIQRAEIDDFMVPAHVCVSHFFLGRWHKSALRDYVSVVTYLYIIRTLYVL